MDLKKYIRSIPDYPKKGILFRDITTLIKNEEAFAKTINVMVERLKNYKTLAYPEIDRKRGFEEIVNSPLYKNYVISEDGKTSGIVVYLKKDERLAEYVKVKDKYFNQAADIGLTKEEKINSYAILSVSPKMGL